MSQSKDRDDNFIWMFANPDDDFALDQRTRLVRHMAVLTVHMEACADAGLDHAADYLAATRERVWSEAMKAALTDDQFFADVNAAAFEVAVYIASDEANRGDDQ